MQPRGKVKFLIDAMKANPDKKVWTTDDAKVVMGIAPSVTSISPYLIGALNQEWLYKHQIDTVRVGYSLEPAAVEVVESEPFSCKLHGDGDLDLHGLVELESGGWRVTRENAKQIRALLTGELFQ